MSTPTPASNLTDEDINDIKFALRSRLVIDNDMSAEDFKQIVRAIEAKVLDRARATAEPTAEAMRKALNQIGLKSYVQAAETLRAALAVGTEIPQKHPDHQVESTGTPTGAANEGRGSSE